MKKLVLFLLVVGIAAGGYYYYHTHLSASFLDQKKMQVSGKEVETWPAEARKRVGITLRRIPNKDNAAVLYIEASNALVKAVGDEVDGETYALNNAWTTDTAFVRWFEKNEPCLRLVHRAVRRPKCEFPVFGERHDCAYAIALPILSPMRDYARLLVCEGRRYEYERKLDDALESYFAVSTIAQHVRESNPVLVTELVSIACYAIGNRPVEMLIAGGSLDAAALQRIVDHYGDVASKLPSFAEVMDGELRALDDTVDAIIARPQLFSELSSLSGEPDAPPLSGQAAAVIRTRGADLKRRYAQSANALRAWAKQPLHLALQPNNSFEHYVEQLPTTDVFGKVFLKTLARSRKQFGRVEALVGGTQIFAAIKLYEKRNGRPPASLNDLKGDCISELPKDPFSGRDYIYKVRGSDWILYSVWDNLTDDGGAGSWPHKMKDDRDCIWLSTPIPMELR